MCVEQDGSEVMAVPVQVQVPNQVVPVYFTLRAQLTTSSLVISPTTLRFGDCCYISEVRRQTGRQHCLLSP